MLQATAFWKKVELQRLFSWSLENTCFCASVKILCWLNQQENFFSLSPGSMVKATLILKFDWSVAWQAFKHGRSLAANLPLTETHKSGVLKVAHTKHTNSENAQSSMCVHIYTKWQPPLVWLSGLQTQQNINYSLTCVIAGLHNQTYLENNFIKFHHNGKKIRFNFVSFFY